MKGDLKLNTYKLAYKFPYFSNVLNGQNDEKSEKKIKGEELALFRNPFFVYLSLYEGHFAYSIEFSPTPFYWEGIWNVEIWI